MKKVFVGHISFGDKVAYLRVVDFINVPGVIESGNKRRIKQKQN